MAVLRIILGILYLIAGLGLGFLGALALYARNWKVGFGSSALAILGFIGAYESFFYKNPLVFWLVFVISLILLLLGILYITEPELGIVDRFKSPERLIKEGKKDKAALKYRKAKRYLEAAKLYEELGWYTSATICYEEAGEWEKAAETYLKLSEKEDYPDYYLRKAKEIYEEKLGDYKRAAEILEKMANMEGWYWEDAAKMWRKAGDREREKRCWEEALKYYKERSEKEDGVFWSDVAVILERLERKDEAVDAYKKFLEYCIRMDKEEGRGWIRHVAETYYALYRLTGDESYKAKGDDALERYKSYLNETVKDENYRKELLEEVKKWLTGFVDLRESLST